MTHPTETGRRRVLRRLTRKHGQYRAVFPGCADNRHQHCSGNCSDPTACCRCTCNCHVQEQP